MERLIIVHKDKSHKLFTIKLHIVSRTVFLLYIHIYIHTYTIIVKNIIHVYRKICVVSGALWYQMVPCTY